MRASVTFAAMFLSICLVQSAQVSSQEQQSPLTATQSDGQIKLLLSKIDKTIESTTNVSLVDLSQDWIQANELSSNASPEGRRLLAAFPNALRQHGVALRNKGEDAKSIVYSVFADYVSGSQKQEPAPPAIAPSPPQPVKLPAEPVKPAPSPPPQPVKLQAEPVKPPLPPPAPVPDPQQVLLDRGDDMLRIGNVVAARSLYQRAAESGAAIAALKLGDTYDSDFLASHKLLGIKADAETAAKWYRKARDLGDTRAVERLRGLQQQHKLAGNLND